MSDLDRCAFRRQGAALAGAALASAILTASGPAAASSLSYGGVSGLYSDAAAGGCGGSVGCSVNQQQTITPATAADTAKAKATDSRFGGENTANASAVSNFASQHAAAQAYASYTGDYYGSYAETAAVSDTYEVFDAAHSYGNPVNANFTITGSVTSTQGIYGASAGLYFQFLVYDMTTGGVVSNNIYENPDPFSGLATFTWTYFVPVGHVYSIESDFESYAYVSSFDTDTFGNHLDVISDFSNTLTYTLIDTVGSGHIVGESGHDYLYSPAAVPEPSTWALALVGLGALGLRRRAATLG